MAVLTKEFFDNQPTDYKKMKKWTLLEDGTICTTWWEVKDYYFDKEYRTFERNEKGELMMQVGEWHTFPEGKEIKSIHLLNYYRVLAQADIKKELLEIRRQIRIKKKRKTQEEWDKLYKMIFNRIEIEGKIKIENKEQDSNCIKNTQN